ncbi:hypothetical protein [Nocardia cyriacigeorgica]|uniref:Uncharacterized protein n=1 Tax=Nocardia cyriacigeorgica (strain GUH-2) TaxID=1127134 RepID=H6R975_NOCCG|nr:hypothetical protein [Nocardia cyriacigeorgica]BDT87285.1 hypothetical protein FMUAM8_30490 [Nocardia cyriacigeorgica]CCF63650.1 membrane protein of unknown function, putative coiled-coil domain [Nocardia cyriacigeorgica GUH-2]
MGTAMIRGDGRLEDVRDVLGMRTPFAWLLAGAFSVTIIVMVFTAATDIGQLWLLALAATIILAAGWGTMLVPGDPLPTRWAITLAAATPLGTAVAVSQLRVPLDTSTQLWFVGATSAYLNFLCVRGATSLAWVATLAHVAICGMWSARTGQGAMTGIGFSFINFIPLLMATVFAKVVRPRARSILNLRRQETEAAAAEAAALAIQQERDHRLARLDRTARPLLEIISSGRTLSVEEQYECRLVEAELRDVIVGGQLVDDEVAQRARAARARGVKVALDDSGGLERADETLRQLVRTVVCDALDYAQAGAVTVRTLPPGRSNLVAILVRDAAELRIEITEDGVIRSDLDERPVAMPNDALDFEG